MRERKRRGFTSAEKTELWDRWQRGESLNAIGRAFGNRKALVDFDRTPKVFVAGSFVNLSSATCQF